MDKNKPLFVFNTRLGADDSENEAGTPSFSMITLIHENEWIYFSDYYITIFI